MCSPTQVGHTRTNNTKVPLSITTAIWIILLMPAFTQHHFIICQHIISHCLLSVQVLLTVGWHWYAEYASSLGIMWPSSNTKSVPTQNSIPDPCLHCQETPTAQHILSLHAQHWHSKAVLEHNIYTLSLGAPSEHSRYRIGYCNHLKVNLGKNYHHHYVTE